MVRGIILITIDSLRADHLNVYGYKKRLVSPCIDSLAKDSLVFLDHISIAPYTSLSMYSLMTASYPIFKSLHNEPCPIPRDKITLAQALNKEGYITIAFQDSNPFLTRDYGYGKGFTIYVDYSDVRTEPSSKLIEKTIDKIIKNHRVGTFLKYYILGFSKPIKGVTGVIKDFMSIIKHLDDYDKKFFIWLHFMDVHGPHNGVNMPSKLNWSLKRSIYWKKGLCSCPRKIIEEFMSMYDEEIRIVDNSIGILINQLKDLDLYNDVMIILTSDHGEEFCDHGGYGHTAKLYDELIRVPLIIKLPKQTKVGVIRNHVTSHLNLMPTIMMLVNPQHTAASQERNLLMNTLGHSVLKGAASLAYSKVYHIISYRTAQWKLICYFKSGSTFPYRSELYNLADDQREQHNVIDCVDQDTISILIKPILLLRKTILLREYVSTKLKRR